MTFVMLSVIFKIRYKYLFCNNLVFSLLLFVLEVFIQNDGKNYRGHAAK